MKTLSKTLVATVALTLLLGSLAFAQESEKTKQVIDEITQKTKDIKSYTVDVKVEAQMMNQMMTTEGTMAFKKPGMMYMTSTMNMMGGMKQEIYAKDDVLWTYMPMMNMASKVDMAKVKAALPGQEDMSGAKDITKPFAGFPQSAIKYTGEKEVDGKKVYVFELNPSMPGQMSPGQTTSPIMPEKVVSEIDTETGLPYKTLMYSADGKLMMEQTYSNYKLNVPLPDSEFEFTPPKDAQVLDMTDSTINMMKQAMQAGTESQPAQQAE